MAFSSQKRRCQAGSIFSTCPPRAFHNAACVCAAKDVGPSDSAVQAAPQAPQHSTQTITARILLYIYRTPPTSMDHTASILRDAACSGKRRMNFPACITTADCRSAARDQGPSRVITERGKTCAKGRPSRGLLRFSAVAGFTGGMLTPAGQSIRGRGSFYCFFFNPKRLTMTSAAVFV